MSKAPYIIGDSRKKGNVNKNRNGKVRREEPVLLEGPLTRQKLERAQAEIQKALDSEESIVLVIQSDGGATDACLDFARWLASLKNDHFLTSKIYAASSGAALIALATNNRKLAQDGIVGLHVGSAQIESADISQDGKVAERLRVLLKESKDELLKLLKKNTVLPPSQLATLDAKGTLILGAEDCKRYLICHSLF